MPADIESALFASGRPAWNGLGKTIPGQASVEQTLELVPELAALVAQRPLMAGSGSDALPARGWYANVRGTVDRLGRELAIEPRVVGVVKGRYAIYQTHEQFELISDLVDGGELAIEAAGTLREGSVTWLLVRTPEAVSILADEVIPYILLVNSFDASYALTWAMTPIRVVCQNTLSLALRSAKRIIRIRHTSSMEGRIGQVREALGLTRVYVSELDRLAEGLGKFKLPERSFAKFLERLVPLPPMKPDPEQPDTFLPNRARDNAVDLRAAIGRIYSEAPDLAGIRGTGWGALQAVTDYWSHAAPSKSADARFERLTLSTSANLVTRAQGILTEMAAS